MGSARTAVAAGESPVVLGALTGTLADDHTVWVAGCGRTSSDSLAAACPPALPWPAGGAPPERIDLLIHCVDVYEAGPLDETPSQLWRDLFDTTVFSFAEIVRVALPSSRAAHGAVIVVNSSTVTESPGGRAVYAACKAALSVVADTLRAEEEDHGVRVRVVEPRWSADDTSIAAIVRSVACAVGEAG